MKAGWEVRTLGEVCTFNYGKALAKSDRKPDGTILVYGANGPLGASDQWLIEGPSLIIGRKGSVGEIHRVDDKFWPTDVTYFTTHDSEIIEFEYLHYALASLNLPSLAKGVKPGLNRAEAYELPIPLPPLDEQRRIVAILDEAFEGLNRARANTLANLEDARALFEDEIDRNVLGRGQGWAITTLDAVCEQFEYGTSAKSNPSGRVPVLRMGNLQQGEIDWSDLVYTDSAADIEKLSLRPLDVLFNRTNSLEHVGKSAIYRGEQAAIFAGYLVHADLPSSD